MVEIKAANIVTSIRIRVTGLNFALFRVRATKWLWYLAAIASGCAVELVVDDRRE